MYSAQDRNSLRRLLFGVVTNQTPNNIDRLHYFGHGSGTSFTWDDDLLVREGEITSLHVTGPDTVALTANQSVLFGGAGNRKAESMTDTTEDGQWQFRGSNVVHRPAGTPLTTDVFTDANGDGHVNVKTYEIGPGDHLSVPVEITLERRPNGWRVQTNVRLHATLNGDGFEVPALPAWQNVLGRPSPPKGVLLSPKP